MRNEHGSQILHEVVLWFCTFAAMWHISKSKHQLYHSAVISKVKIKIYTSQQVKNVSSHFRYHIERFLNRSSQRRTCQGSPWCPVVAVPRRTYRRILWWYRIDKYTILLTLFPSLLVDPPVSVVVTVTLCVSTLGPMFSAGAGVAINLPLFPYKLGRIVVLARPWTRLFPTNDGAVIAHALVAVVPPNLMMSVRLSVPPPRLKAQISAYRPKSNPIGPSPSLLA